MKTINTMYPAACIANDFVKKGPETGIYVTQMQLQKMVFFAHGYYLAKYDQPLIEENFQAWKFGPVVPGIYRAFRDFGSRPIIYQGYDFRYDVPVELYTLDNKAKDAIDYTWETTKTISAFSLSNWTHQPGTPWYKTYDPSNMNKVIENAEIKKYFKGLLTIQPQEA